MSGAPSNNAPNWLGLLQWSLKYQDGTTPTEHSPLTEEKRIFLENVMKEMVRDEPERLYLITNNIIGYIAKSNLASDNLQLMQLLQDHHHSADLDIDIQDNLEECEDIIHQIDMANVFINKYQGLQYLLCILENKSNDINILIPNNYSIRTLVASIIGTLAQNNEDALLRMYAYPSQPSIASNNTANVLVKLINTCIVVCNSDDDTVTNIQNKDKLINKVMLLFYVCYGMYKLYIYVYRYYMPSPAYYLTQVSYINYSNLSHYSRYYSMSLHTHLTCC